MENEEKMEQQLRGGEKATREEREEKEEKKEEDMENMVGEELDGHWQGGKRNA